LTTALVYLYLLVVFFHHLKEALHTWTRTCLPHYKSIVRPHLEYGSNIWSVMHKKEAIQIENVQRRATKLVNNILTVFDSITFAGKLFQVSTTLCVKLYFFNISSTMLRVGETSKVVSLPSYILHHRI
jgi:hypothetical protein